VSEGRAESGEDPRVRLAGERTLLAWVRTGLAMMAFGFVVARFGVFLHELAPNQANVLPASSGPSFYLGTALVVLGAAVNLLAAFEHFLFIRRIDRGQAYRPPRWSSGIVVSVILALCGICLTAYLVFLLP